MQYKFEIADPAKEALVALMQKAQPSLDSKILYDSIVRPPNIDKGDYALPCFRIAKELGVQAIQWASQIADGCTQEIKRQGDPWVASCHPEGAFLNFKIHRSKMADYLFQPILDGAYFKDPKFKSRHHVQKTMIEYSQPNTHKNFHIGHVRNVCLGDSLYRLFNYCGYPTIPVNYIGDEGTHIAECLWYIQSQQLQKPTQISERVIWLENAYSSAKKLLSEANESQRKILEAEVGKVHHSLESKSGLSYELWLETKQWCMDAFKEIYNWLDVKFDHYFFESEMTEESQEIVDEYLQKGVLKLDQGAVGIDLSEHKLGFALYRKSNGATLYATKDLALARRKFDEYDIKRSIYVVAAEQNLHFQQVFKTLEHMGFKQAKNCYHLSYALVRLPDGKMSTRKGNAVHFNIVRENMLVKVKEVLDKYKDEWSTQEIEDTAKHITVSAIKYGMLNMDPHKEIVFQMDDWLSFEGNTGPYLLYTLTRAKAILRKSNQSKSNILNKMTYENMEKLDCDLLLQYLYDLNAVIASSCENYKPSTLCNHLYYMCKEFNRFYASTPILKSEDARFVQQALAMVASFATSLEEGLKLIGIRSIDRM